MHLSRRSRAPSELPSRSPLAPPATPEAHQRSSVECAAQRKTCWPAAEGRRAQHSLMMGSRKGHTCPALPAAPLPAPLQDSGILELEAGVLGFLVGGRWAQGRSAGAPLPEPLCRGRSAGGRCARFLCRETPSMACSWRTRPNPAAASKRPPRPCRGPLAELNQFSGLLGHAWVWPE